LEKISLLAAALFFPDAFIGIDLIVMAVKKEIQNFMTMGVS